MIGMKLAAAKGGFFDSAKVQRSMDANTRRALSKFGAFVRRRAKSSIRKRKGISPAGSPPSSHTGLLRSNIFFVAETEKNNVVIGPILLNGTKSPTALQALEHGGQTLIMGRGKNKGKMVPAIVEARPFMQPAFEIEIEKAPYLWENGLR
jgi:hypothetical protein